MTVLLPRAGAPLTEGGGPPTREHYRWCQIVTDAVNSGQLSGTTAQEAIATIATALGSPDGTVENIPPQNESDAAFISGSGSLNVFGTLAAGSVQLSLTGDVQSPGASYVYGTDADGERTWRELATTDNLDEGASNLYFPEAPIDGASYTRKDGAWVVAPAGASEWTTVKKTADEARVSTTTLADDSQLSFAAALGVRYHVRAVLLLEAANGTMDMKTAPAFSGTAANVIHSRIINSSASSTPIHGIGNALTTTAPDIAAAGFVRLDYNTIFDASTAGTFSIQWAQNTSNASALKMRAGSYLEYMAC